MSGNRRENERPATTPLSQLEAAAQAAATPFADDVDVRLALIDFGMTARLAAAQRDGATRLLMALGDHRGDQVAATLIDLGQPGNGFDRVGYTAEISAIVERSIELTAADVQTGRLLFDILDVSYRNGLRLPAEMTLLAKALFNLDGVTRSLDPTFRPIETIRAYSSEIAMTRARRDLSPQRIYRLAVESGDLIAALPRRLDQITERLANNDLSTKLDIPELPTLIVALQKVANRIFSGLVLAGLLVASAMLMSYWRVLGTAGFVVAAVVALYMVFTILITDRRNDRR